MVWFLNQRLLLILGLGYNMASVWRHFLETCGKHCGPTYPCACPAWAVLEFSSPLFISTAMEDQVLQSKFSYSCTTCRRCGEVTAPGCPAVAYHTCGLPLQPLLWPFSNWCSCGFIHLVGKYWVSAMARHCLRSGSTSGQWSPTFVAPRARPVEGNFPKDCRWRVCFRMSQAHYSYCALYF